MPLFQDSLPPWPPSTGCDIPATPFLVCAGWSLKKGGHISSWFRTWVVGSCPPCGCSTESYSLKSLSSVPQTSSILTLFSLNRLIKVYFQYENLNSKVHISAWLKYKETKNILTKNNLWNLSDDICFLMARPLKGNHSLILCEEPSIIF